MAAAAMASSSCTSLRPSPPLPTRFTPPLGCSLLKLNQIKSSGSFLVSTPSFFPKPVRASKTEETKGSTSGTGKDGDDKEEEEKEEDQEYEVELVQPYGLKFAKGRDGGTYIDAIAPGGSADKAGVFSVGDKVIATSAVFGEEIWPAAEYGRTMYTIRQRIGPLLMKMQKRYGKMDETGELTEKEIIRAERNSGVIGGRVREIQMQNYLRKKERKEQREKDLREGLKLYRSGNYDGALEKFESVLGSKPEPDEAAIASYNVACCYSKINQIQAAISALEEALKDGFEDFKRIRSDPDLENVRKSEDFEPLMKKFDESFINENAINAIKSIFGFNKK
ncbi:protein MET1, chloroplastic [Andrographis paniculata]|uniref:protein MET1, chloroplastic n=1 Tax=Andrographis paniculata TaxID=175694 RepID=UPI0021E800D2|nr:protein MET1, chloroplastic [Andrographis paniculata]